MKFKLISLFPKMFDALSSGGVVARAIEKKLLQLEHYNIRDYADGLHKTVDDRPYGGGPGMVLLPEPLAKVIDVAKSSSISSTKVVYLSPSGNLFNQEKALELVKSEEIILLCGRYEGIDERIVEEYVDEELSVGNYVLSGGELPAMILIDTVARLLPGVLGDPRSVSEDSFMDGLLDHPHYTRPLMHNDNEVPEVLRSGDHAKINAWRLKQALGRTYLRRPDLLASRTLSEREKVLLQEFKQENNIIN